MKLDTNFVITKICSTRLLTSYEQELILTCYSLHQKKYLLLEQLRHMEIKTVCELIEEDIPMIGIQLVAGTYMSLATYMVILI